MQTCSLCRSEAPFVHRLPSAALGQKLELHDEAPSSLFQVTITQGLLAEDLGQVQPQVCRACLEKFRRRIGSRLRIVVLSLLWCFPVGFLLPLIIDASAPSPRHQREVAKTLPVFFVSLVIALVPTVLWWIATSKRNKRNAEESDAVAFQSLDHSVTLQLMVYGRHIMADPELRAKVAAFPVKMGPEDEEFYFKGRYRGPWGHLMITLPADGKKRRIQPRYLWSRWGQY